ncbi:hypothetical protein D3C72_1850140 [compost metagenome]
MVLFESDSFQCGDCGGLFAGLYLVGTAPIKSDHSVALVHAGYCAKRRDVDDDVGILPLQRDLYLTYLRNENLAFRCDTNRNALYSRFFADSFDNAVCGKNFKQGRSKNLHLYRLTWY